MVLRGLLAPVGLSAPVSAVVWSLVLFVVLGLGGAAMKLAKKRWFAKTNGPGETSSSGFTMERLEELRRSGQINAEEFTRVRRQVLGVAQAASMGSHLEGQSDSPHRRTGGREAGTAGGDASPSRSSPPLGHDDGNASGA